MLRALMKGIRSADHAFIPTVHVTEAVTHGLHPQGFGRGLAHFTQALFSMSRYTEELADSFRPIMQKLLRNSDVETIIGKSVDIKKINGVDYFYKGENVISVAEFAKKYREFDLPGIFKKLNPEVELNPQHLNAFNTFANANPVFRLERKLCGPMNTLTEADSALSKAVINSTEEMEALAKANPLMRRLVDKVDEVVKRGSGTRVGTVVKYALVVGAATSAYFIIENHRKKMQMCNKTYTTGGSAMRCCAMAYTMEGYGDTTDACAYLHTVKDMDSDWRDANGTYPFVRNACDDTYLDIPEDDTAHYAAYAATWGQAAADFIGDEIGGIVSAASNAIWPVLRPFVIIAGCAVGGYGMYRIIRSEQRRRKRRHDGSSLATVPYIPTPTPPAPVERNPLASYADAYRPGTRPLSYRPSSTEGINTVAEILPPSRPTRMGG